MRTATLTGIPSPSEPADRSQHERLNREQYLLACKTNQSSTPGLPILAAAVALVLNHWISFEALFLWWCGVAAVTIANIAIDSWQARSVVDQDNFKRWIALRCVHGLLFHATWTAPAYLFWSHCDISGQLFLILIYTCSIPAAVSVLAACGPWIASVFVPLACAIIIPTAFSGSSFLENTAILGVLFLGYMGVVASQQHNAARTLLLLREEKSDLVNEVMRAKVRSDEALARAEAASQAKTDFLANMSHELRTPLNAVIGFSDLIKARGWRDDPLERCVEYAESINVSGRYLLQLINDILDLAKIEAGKFELRHDEVDLSLTANEALRLVHLRAQAKGIRVSLQASARVVLNADERAVLQILTNLLSNAIKFTPKDGMVSVRVSEPCERQGVAVTVRDTGVGIKPADMDRIMESFGQGRHEVSTTDERGTGLGLPIVRGLIEAHGGRFEMQSELGNGTVATIHFPPARIVGVHVAAPPLSKTA